MVRLRRGLVLAVILGAVFSFVIPQHSLDAQAGAHDVLSMSGFGEPAGPITASHLRMHQPLYLLDQMRQVKAGTLSPQLVAPLVGGETSAGARRPATRCAGLPRRPSGAPDPASRAHARAGSGRRPRTFQRVGGSRPLPRRIRRRRAHTLLPSSGSLGAPRGSILRPWDTVCCWRRSRGRCRRSRCPTRR